jgi:hypothetical protein
MTNQTIEATIHLTTNGVTLVTTITEKLFSVTDAETRLAEIKDYFVGYRVRCGHWTLEEDEFIAPAKTDKIAITWYGMEFGKDIRSHDDIRNRWKYLNKML